MIGLVEGKIYTISEENLSQDILQEFCDDRHKNDLLCVEQKSGIKIFINSEDVKNAKIDAVCYEIASKDVFFQLYSNPHITEGGVVPILSSEGNPIAIAKYFFTNYNHNYDCDIQKIDTSVFDLYESVCLYGVNEYSVLMYHQCFTTYKGNVILYGSEWNSILPYLGRGAESAEVFVVASEEELEQKIKNKKAMRLSVFTSNLTGAAERYCDGIFSYDEIMALVYLFAQHKVISEKDDKKVFLLDVNCSGLGLVAMLNHFTIPYTYIKSKGYIPIMNVEAADESIFSDYPGDDIWCKFFRQPSGIELENLKGVADITISPLTPFSYPVMSLMLQLSGGEADEFRKIEYFNDRLLEHIDRYRKHILPEPENTLGVLIRGTDYTATKPKEHPVQATPEQVIEKIKELSKEKWNFKNIFVATEDAQALKKICETFGDKVKYIDQKRFVSHEGERLQVQKYKDTWKRGDGWKYGADYLSAMVLLSECGFFLASGRCSGQGLVEKLTEGKNYPSYVFDLGLYK